MNHLGFNQVPGIPIPTVKLDDTCYQEFPMDRIHSLVDVRVARKHWGHFFLFPRHFQGDI